MAEEKSKKPTYEELEAQLKNLEKALNFYIGKCNQLEFNAVVNQPEQT